MSPFEKSLYHWYEINAYARELTAATPSDSTIMITAESIFRAEARSLAALASFCGILGRAQFQELLCKPYRERRRHKPAALPDWRVVFDHPDVMKLASEFGYTFDLDDEQFQRQYIAN